MQLGDSFKVICDECMRYDGANLFAQVLQPAIAVARETLLLQSHWCELRSSLPGALPNVDFQVQLQEMFAFSVLNDHLLWELANARLKLAEYKSFWTSLGMDVFEAGSVFNPALCEIVAVTEEPVNASLQTRWPGLRWGELVFSRCGVSLAHDPGRGIIKGIADTSVLYFCNRRANRKCADLSHGWGGNSRWRTDFHRNYCIGPWAFFNVDGSVDLVATPAEKIDNLQDDGLTVAEAQELLINRCMVQTAKDNSGDLFPYHWKLAARMDIPVLWPLPAQALLPFEDALRLAGCI